jgi:hypothetical protein
VQTLTCADTSMATCYVALRKTTELERVKKKFCTEMRNWNLTTNTSFPVESMLQWFPHLYSMLIYEERYAVIHDNMPLMFRCKPRILRMQIRSDRNKHSYLSVPLHTHSIHFISVMQNSHNVGTWSCCAVHVDGTR